MLHPTTRGELRCFGFPFGVLFGCPDASSQNRECTITPFMARRPQPLLTEREKLRNSVDVFEIVQTGRNLKADVEHIREIIHSS